MFPGCYNVDGRLRLKFALPPGTESYNHGIACGADFVYATATPPTGFVNGLPVLLSTSQYSTRSVATGFFNNGFPFDTATQAHTNTPGPALSFHNGIPFNGSVVAYEVVP